MMGALVVKGLRVKVDASKINLYKAALLLNKHSGWLLDYLIFGSK